MHYSFLNGIVKIKSSEVFPGHCQTKSFQLTFDPLGGLRYSNLPWNPRRFSGNLKKQLSGEENQPMVDFVRLNILPLSDNAKAVLPPQLKPEKQEDYIVTKLPDMSARVGQALPLLRKPRDKPALPTRKLENNLKHLGKGKPAIILVLGGSFNPVHKMHVQLFESAKKYLKDTNGDDQVVGGFIVPSADDYVKEKLGSNAMAFRHRANTCHLAVEKSPWIETCDWGSINVNQACKAIAEQLSKEFPRREFHIIEVCGADYAIKYKLDGNDFDVLCFARNGSTDRLKKVGGRSNISLIEENLDDISSTEVRKLIQYGAIADLLEKKCLPSGVLDYILQNGDSLFY